MKREAFNQRLAKSIRKARIDSELTQEQLAKMCGLTADWISHFECGQRSPDAFALYKLTHAKDNEFQVRFTPFYP